MASTSRRPARAAERRRRSAEESAGALIARYYDLDLAEEPGDTDLYLALAAAGTGRILELCAGSGRLAVPLAAVGHHVTAVDIDTDMLDRARRYWKRQPRRKADSGSLTLIESDVTLLDLPDRYDLVILALNSLLLLDGRDAQLAALRAMARHLAPNGRAVIDVWLPSQEDLALYDGRLMLEWVRREVKRDEWVAKQVAARYDQTTDQAEITTFFDAWRDTESPRRTMRRDTAHFVSAKALAALCKKAGLTVTNTYGDYSRAPYRAGDERVLLVCRAGRSSRAGRSYGGRSGSD